MTPTGTSAPYLATAPKIRHAVTRDAKAISEHIRSFLPGLAFVPAASKKEWIERKYTSKIIGEQILTGDREWLVIETETGGLEATAFLGRDGELGGLYVSTPGQGLGSRLVAVRLALATKSRIGNIHSIVHDRNTAMIRILENHDFVAGAPYPSKKVPGVRFVVLRHAGFALV
jgi:hypothetical protein